MLQVIPFKCVNAFTDLSQKIIYLARDIKTEDIKNVMCDEFAHLISGSATHDKKWEDACNRLYGFVPPHNNAFDETLGKLSMGCNVGNVTGIQNLLTDYHLLQAYRKFSQRILGTDGGWEVTGNNKIRLKPTPKGSFPVVVRYLPSVDDFQIPTHKEVCLRALIAEAKIILGHVRRKLSIPGPDGGTINTDGDALVTEGREERDKVVEYAISLGEPLGFYIR